MASPRQAQIKNVKSRLPGCRMKALLSKGEISELPRVILDDGKVAADLDDFVSHGFQSTSGWRCIKPLLGSKVAL